MEKPPAMPAVFISQAPRVTAHVVLKVPEATRLILREREGRTVYFRPNSEDDLVRAIIKAVL